MTPDSNQKLPNQTLAQSKTRAWIISVLAILTLFAYWNIRHAGFINFDDDLYVTKNDRVKSGLELDNILWAFQVHHTEDNAHYHPLTWISHMADCELFGLSPAGHHLVNLLFHILNVAILFWAFQKMTGDLFGSAALAGLFALHPVNVDSVAWIAQRKNLLSTFFWLLGILAYSGYAVHGRKSNYFMTFAFFLLGLLTKPMVVTFPFTLLLLDIWPLNRVRTDSEQNAHQSVIQRIVAPLTKLIIEKTPFFILTAGFVILSSTAQKGYGEIVPLQETPLAGRIGNAFISYSGYIKNALFPVNLSVYYPYPETVSLLWSVVSAFILIGISIFAIRLVRKKPYVFSGWFWFLGTLVPVIGLMQTGLWPAMADRWAYIPYIGLFMIVSYGCWDILRRLRFGGIIYAVIFFTIFAVLAGLTRVQTGYWKNSGTLFAHAITATRNNYVAHNNLGLFLSGPEAERHFKAAIEIKPDFYKAYNNLGMAQYRQQKKEEAVLQFKKAIELNPDYTTAYNNLAVTLSEMGDLNEARRYFEKALEIDPNHAGTHLSYGTALAKRQLYDQAAIQFNKALEINPDYAEAYNNLGLLLKEQGKTIDAIQKFNRALKIAPEYRDAQLNRQDVLAALGMTRQAITAAMEGLRRNPGDYGLNRYLGNVYRSKGELDKAVSLYIKALETGYPQPETLIDSGIAYAMQGDYASASNAFESAIELKPDDALPYYHIACVLALENKAESAVQWLKRSVEHGFSGLTILETDKRLDNIRNSASFQRFMKSIRTRRPPPRNQ